MAKELIIPFSERIPKSGKTQRFSFLDDEGNLVPLHKLFGRTTTWSDWNYGLTRIVDGKTWWIIQATGIVLTGNPQDFLHIDKNNKIMSDNFRTYTMPVHLFAHLNERAIIDLTKEEAQILGHKNQTIAIAVKEGSAAWDIFYGTKKASQLPVSQTVKSLDEKINKYISSQQDQITIGNITLDLTKTGIKKLTNYTPVKAMNKINEIIEYLNND